MLNIFKKFHSEEKQKIIIFAGAGLSQESGLDTFRGNNGLWNNHNIDEVCNFKTFLENKEMVFEFYNERKKDILKVSPNHAHFGIAKIQKKYGDENVHVFTSNIDNLLEKAGCQNVCHVHGDIHHMQCLSCEHNWFIGDNPYNIQDKCPKCHYENIKPAIVFFHEKAPKYHDLYEYFQKSSVIKKGNLVPHIKLIIGTSFKVIKPEAFFIRRGKTILLDKFPNIEGIENDFTKILPQSATQGIDEVINTIEQWYLS